MVCAADITGYFVMVMFGFVHTQEIVGLSHISHDPITTVILSSQGQHQTKVWLSHVHAEHVDAQPARHSRLDVDDGGAAGGEAAGPGEISQHPPGDLQGEPWRGESQYNAMMECDLTQINLVNWFLFPLWSETFSCQISFLYVSRLSCLSGSSPRKEGLVKKRHGDFRAGGGCRSVSPTCPECWVLMVSPSWSLCWSWPLSCCVQLPTHWARRWLMVLDTAVLYVNQETGGVVSWLVSVRTDFLYLLRFNWSLYWWITST